jgi:hypothetical protein
MKHLIIILTIAIINESDFAHDCKDCETNTYDIRELYEWFGKRIKNDK